MGTYVVTNCKQNLQALGYGRNNRSSPEDAAAPAAPDAAGNNNANNRHEISINVIPTSASMLPPHRKIMFIAPAPACTHLSECISKID